VCEDDLRIIERRRDMSRWKEGPYRPGWYQEGRCWRFRNYRAIDVFAPGKKPWGHPVVKRGKRGAAILTKGQVWVERGYDHCWQIANLLGPRGSMLVELRPYRCRESTRTLTEQTFRSIMEIWEDSLERKRALMGKLRRSAKAHGMTIRGTANFFGIDPFTGHRID
jgi:hypothetical protein